MEFDILSTISFNDFIYAFSFALIVFFSVRFYGSYFMALNTFIPVYFLELFMYSMLTFLVIVTPYLFQQSLWHLWGLLFAYFLTCTTMISFLRFCDYDYPLFYTINMIIHGLIGVYLRSTLIYTSSFLFMIGLIGFKMGFGPGFVSL